MAHNFLYKCRLCGEEYSRGVTGSRDVAADCITDMLLGSNYASKKHHVVNILSVYGMHLCADGSVGMSDFCGARKEEE